MPKAAKKEKDYSNYAPTILRFVLGGFLITAAVLRFLNIEGVTQFIWQYGFPIPYFFAWLWILTEFIFGLMVLIGWNVKYTVWPLVIVLGLLVTIVYLPAIKETILFVWFYLMAIAALVSLSLTGPGALSVN